MENFLDVLEFPESISQIDVYDNLKQGKIYLDTELFVKNNFSVNDNLIVSLSFVIWKVGLFI